MSTENEPMDTDDTDDTERGDLRQLREKARQADELAGRVAEMEREMAFRRAGIDPTDDRQGYFARGYQGDLDPDAIKAAAATAGFVQAPAPPGQPDPVPAAERDAWARTADVAAGSTAVPTPNVKDAFRAAVNDGTLRTADDIADWIAGKAPDAVSYDGPIGEFTPTR